MYRRPRLVPFVASLVLLVSLGLARPSAEARVEQFCGYTQFADLVIIHATIEEASRLVIPGQWVQIVPHLYTLLGAGTIVRDPLLTVAQEFLGGFTLVNPSQAFLANPICAVSTTLVVVDEDLPLITGPALVTCIGGPSGTFQPPALQLRLTNCNEPGFPVSAAALAQEASDRIGTTKRDPPKIPLGEAPNEYVGR